MVELLGFHESSSEDMLREIAAISAEEKNEIKKGIRFRAKMTIAAVLYLIFAEVYLYLELVEVGLSGGVYGAFSIGLLGMLGTILGCALYSLVNAKKL